MDCGLPPPSERLLHREAGVVEPSLVEKFGRAVWPTRPCQRGNLVDHRPKIVHRIRHPISPKALRRAPSFRISFDGVDRRREGRRRSFQQEHASLADGRPIELGGRAFDTLMVLIDARGTVLGKDELMNRVWPDRVVEENNLQAQISALRKVFGADRDLIRTVAGRGYQFTGEIRKGVTSGAAGPARLTNLPTPQSELIGREAPLRDVTNLVVAHRLVTLTGAGGVGKTRLALEATRQLLPRFLDGAWLAELGPLADADLVPVAVAAALGLSLGAGPVTTDRVAAALRAKHLLLVIDNCEHVIEVAAAMAEAVLRASPLTRVLATSREPLRATEEYVYRVPSLDVPVEDNVDVEDVSRHGAVRLFNVRAHAAEPGYDAHPRHAVVAARICRRLDGIPLAIELAAARVPAFGVDGIASRLGAGKSSRRRGRSAGSSMQ